MRVHQHLSFYIIDVSHFKFCQMSLNMNHKGSKIKVTMSNQRTLKTTILAKSFLKLCKNICLMITQSLTSLNIPSKFQKEKGHDITHKFVNFHQTSLLLLQEQVFMCVQKLFHISQLNYFCAQMTEEVIL